MKTTVEVLERMGSIVVHVRQTAGPDEHETTLVLDDDHAAAELNLQLARMLAKRRARPAQEKPPELRWFKVRKINGRDAGEQYVQAYGVADARQKSRYAGCHGAEVTVSTLHSSFSPEDAK